LCCAGCSAAHLPLQHRSQALKQVGQGPSASHSSASNPMGSNCQEQVEKTAEQYKTKTVDLGVGDNGRWLLSP